jgi:hypothetical protein
MDHLEKLLEATCPNHTYPIMYSLKECTLMKNYMTTGSLVRNKKSKGDLGRKAAPPFLEEKVVMLIYGGPPPPHESCRKLKLTSQAVNCMSVAIPEY